jgi:aminopeptidase
LSLHRTDKLARLLVRYSTGVKPGDVVSLVAPPLAEPLVVALFREVLCAGGHPLVVMSPEACNETFYRHARAEQLAFVNPLEAREIEVVDVRIHALAPTNTRGTTGLDADQRTIHQQARRQLLELFLRRTARHSLRWAVTQFPCAAAARDAAMSLNAYDDFLARAALLDRDDPAGEWRCLSERQARLLDFLYPIRELHLMTPAGTDLRLGVQGRTWINGDGRDNLPDGEIFTAPVEDAVEGTAYFDFPAVYAGKEVRGVRLVFRAGRVVEAAAASGEDFLVRMLDQEPGARVLGEVAFGCNYAISRPTRNALLDEKMGGTFHLALGAAYPASGGVNQSALHWDLVGDLRRGGRVLADGRPVSVNGRFVDAAWPGQ